LARPAAIHRNPLAGDVPRHVTRQELDDPAEASRCLAAASDETLKTNLPLAAQPIQTLSAESALKLAEWYADLAAKSDAGGREVANARARSCYLRFFELHSNRRDALATRAGIGLQKIGGTVPNVTVPGAKPPAGPSRLIKPGGEIFDLKLAELAASNPDMTQLTSQEIGTARQIMDLRPLGRLSKLSVLELQEISGVSDLSPISRLSGLTSLTLTRLTVNSTEALSGLSSLTALDLSGARNISDLRPLGRLTQLRTLTLANCASVTDLSPIANLAGLTGLTLSRCEKLSDLSPIEKLSGRLTALNLAGCSGIADIYSLSKCTALKSLDLRGCGRIPAADIEWLQKQLSGCKIQSGALEPPAGQERDATP
jgi:hypothetical protein